ncbi:MAG: OmpA family protein [Oscillospiraceae bacterium]|jgi:chemotaxis protein MotB|nr:OmpA family protein [Oscillospiraceae bacterium]
MARKPKGGDEGGGANWMDTYGDLVTLLLCFFVLLFSFASMDAAKWEELKSAFSGVRLQVFDAIDPQSAFTRPIDTIPRSANEGIDEDDDLGTADADLAAEAARENFEELVDSVQDYIDKNGINASTDIDYDHLVLIIRFSDNVFFDSGKAVIKQEAYPSIDDFCDLLVEQSGRFSEIKIEGHTDNVPIHTAQFKSNWELSGTRASEVLQYMIASGKFEDGLLRAFSTAGCGEYRPIAPNDTAEGRGRNRRVDFVIQAHSADFYKDGDESST